jgi:hypothetical protein
MLVTALAHGHSNQTNQDVKRGVVLGGYVISLIYIAYILDLCIMVVAFYYYFKCHFAKGAKSSTSDKVGGFLGACCCHLLYAVYHYAVPC